MQVLTSFHAIDEAFQQPALQGHRSVVTIGSFDGLHLGHQYIINELVQWARQSESLACVMTFREHPRTYMTGVEQQRILSLDHKLALLEELEVDLTLLVQFDEQLQNTDAARFCSELLVQRCHARGLLVGHNNRIGRGREGTPERLRDELGPAAGLEVRISDAVQVAGHSLSSSAIREHIESGDFHWSRKMLGRPYTIRGVVQPGRRLGRTIGFPTLNLALDGLVHPPLGVYGVRARIDRGEWMQGAANIGLRPTVEQDRQIALLEVHVLAEDSHPLPEGEVAGQQLEVEPCFFVRPEMRFAGIEDLRDQISRDLTLVRSRFTHA